jgi:hypothetical protein
MLLKDVLEKAVAAGLTLVAYYDDPSDTDYVGTDIAKCTEALEACDVMNLGLRSADNKKMGWFLIVNEFEGDPEEQIADYSLSEWTKENFPQEDI